MWLSQKGCWGASLLEGMLDWPPQPLPLPAQLSSWPTPPSFPLPFRPRGLDHHGLGVAPVPGPHLQGPELSLCRGHGYHRLGLNFRLQFRSLVASITDGWPWGLDFWRGLRLGLDFEVTGCTSKFVTGPLTGRGDGSVPPAAPQRSKISAQPREAAASGCRRAQRTQGAPGPRAALTHPQSHCG